jgi:hypothetical protein
VGGIFGGFTIGNSVMGYGNDWINLFYRCTCGCFRKPFNRPFRQLYFIPVVHSRGMLISMCMIAFLLVALAVLCA